MDIEGKTDHNVCALCTTDMSNYGVGKCNHVVCGKCAIRMRVICDSKDCPVCRQHMERVFITKAPMTFNQLDQTKYILNAEFDLLFESRLEEKYFEGLMTCKCQVCGDISRSMSALNRHYHNTHQLMFCDLCLNNLKHFPIEFPVYTGAELVKHRAWSPAAPGRGHPLCQFCERRYYDADEWYKHLRRDHFMCHVCEREAADTTSKRTVFGDFDHLLEHCRTAHFVCEEGDCVLQTFTNVFGSEAEMKSHRLTFHSLTKAEVRENRRLDVEIRFTADTTAEQSIHRERGGPSNVGRGGGSGGGGGAGRGFRKNREPRPEASGLDLDMRNLPGMAQALEISQSVDAQYTARANGEVPYEENPQDFPTLRGHAPDFNRPPPVRGATRSSPIPNGEESAEEDDDLWAGPKAPETKTSTTAVKDSKPGRNTESSSGGAERAGSDKNWQRAVNPAAFMSTDDFPALTVSAGNRQSSVPAGGVWKKSSASSAAFTSPRSAVPLAAVTTAAATTTASRTQSKAMTTDINSHDNFPSLGGGHKGSSRQAPDTSSALPWKPSAVVPPKSVSQVSRVTAAPKLSNENFPSLGGLGSSNSGKNIPWQSVVKVPAPAKKATTNANVPQKTTSNPPRNIERETRPAPPVDRFEDTPRAPSYAEEKVGTRLTAAEAYESVGPHQGQQSKVQLIRPSTSNSSTNSGMFRMKEDDFPSMINSNRSASDASWGPPAMAHSDLFIDVPDVPKSTVSTVAQHRVKVPNVESASDFPTLGDSRPRVDPTAVTNKGHMRDMKKAGKKGKKGRQARPAEPEDESSNNRSGPIQTPFSLGDLAASLLNAEYHEVPDMDQRNQLLFETLSEMLGPRFESFALSSNRYRNREITARSYVDAIGELVSKAEVASFMPEMLVLLPDIGLQKSLLSVMEPELRRHLRECTTCGQVVTSADLPFHLSVH